MSQLAAWVWRACSALGLQAELGFRLVLPSGQAWGRPVGVAGAEDGSLLVTDDGSNSIWRVDYVGGSGPQNNRQASSR